MAAGWTSAEDDRLRALWGTDTLARLAPSFGRSQARVRYRAQVLGLIGVPPLRPTAAMGRWSDAEENELRARWADTDRPVIAQLLRRSYGAVGRRAHKLGLVIRSGSDRRTDNS